METVLARPEAGEFARLTDPYRRELLVHCYRMLGSVHDAEDLVQETYLRAWRAFDRFEGRSSLRTWLYRIATHACLRALENRGRRPMPSGLGGPSGDPEGALEAPPREVTWLQPIPDALLSADPAQIATSREGTRLAFAAALQHLPARQRAVLILRDVLGWRASEVAELLDTSTAAVNSALQRARAQLEQAGLAEDTLVEPSDPERRELLDRFVAAFENGDAAALTRILRDDAVLEMPPFTAWFAGRDAIARFMASQGFAACGGAPMIPTAANGQPALASYERHGDGVRRAHGIHVLTLTDSGIARIRTFLDTSLFATFGLPSSVPDAGRARTGLLTRV
ncbi:sigma-70 family RNA polymerase sigma factor [Glycomyces albidus]|jgi:RNA polymerase sigma-70 factor (ECF subfamily)|uniref:RNA polymerase sigma factor n=1 Tax=Glycomyces albidus TaxID=2656774 RepID=A0A6L5G7E1_9ACTN|nr:sigma-70 family RNA polymerase sigma factor [Glycomyces albidus]MQM25575.1 sigma-70 family RNA polymerase sigma factor [Glycomyces albidus]